MAALQVRLWSQWGLLWRLPVSVLALQGGRYIWWGWGLAPALALLTVTLWRQLALVSSLQGSKAPPSLGLAAQRGPLPGRPWPRWELLSFPPAQLWFWWVRQSLQ